MGRFGKLHHGILSIPAASGERILRHTAVTGSTGPSSMGEVAGQVGRIGGGPPGGGDAAMPRVWYRSAFGHGPSALRAMPRRGHLVRDVAVTPGGAGRLHGT